MSEQVSIRLAMPEDAYELAKLHVQTFNETHGPGPSVEVRESQWRQKLADDRSFCFVAVDSDQNLIAFACGHPYDLDDLPYDGHLEKIYVLKSWQRKGVGRRLVAEVVKVFLSRGIHSMLLFSQANNPSIGFFERLGGQRLLSPEGEFHGGYGWPEIRNIATS